MSKIIVELNEKDRVPENTPLEDYEPHSGKKTGFRIFGIFVVILSFVFVIAGIAGVLYWRHLKSTPQYSLALLIEAARNEDRKTIDEIVDTDRVVEDFVPQVTEKAVEIYGRGLPPEIVKQVSIVAAPVMPVIKDRVRSELPGLLRERTKQFENVPFFLLAASADRFLDIKLEGQTARISSKLKKRPLSIVMRKDGERWRIIAVRDEVLAKRIAEKIGQQIIALVRGRDKDSLERAGREIGLENLGELIEKAGEIFKIDEEKKE